MGNLLLMCQMIASKVGKTGIAVTVDVDSYNPATMARAVVVTGAAATEAINGRYYYWVQNYDEALVYTADFKTADATVDQQYLAAFAWDGAMFHKTELARLDATVGSRAAATIFTGITSLTNWLRGMFRKDAMDAAAKAEVNLGGGTYNETTDSNEAIRDALVSAALFPAGAINFTYTLTHLGIPIDNAAVWISTDNPVGGNPANVIWSGMTDAFGVARDVMGNIPALDPGTYYFWRSKPGMSFTDPDTEVAS